MKVYVKHLVVVGLILYIAFFTHPPPLFVSTVLQSPVGQVLVLLGVVYTATKDAMVGLFLGIAYLASSFPVLEYLDAKEQKPKEKEQPKSGAPMPDMKTIGKLASILGGKGGKLMTQQGKDVKAPPPSHTAVKPHADPKVVEKFSAF
jgi:hypothetical protein